MALSREDKKDVASAFGKKAASAVSKATRDSGYDKAFKKKTGMAKVSLGPKAKSEFAYTVHDAASGRMEKSGGNKDSVKKLDSSYARMNAERKRQGYAPKSDRASKGLYDFLDK